MRVIVVVAIVFVIVGAVGLGAHPVRRLPRLAAAAGLMRAADQPAVVRRVAVLIRRRRRAALLGLLLAVLPGFALHTPVHVDAVLFAAGLVLGLAAGEVDDVRRAAGPALPAGRTATAALAGRRALLAAAGAAVIVPAGGIALVARGSGAALRTGSVVDAAGLCRVTVRRAPVASTVTGVAVVAALGVLAGGCALAIARRPAWPDIPAAVDTALRRSSVSTVLGAYAAAGWTAAGGLLLALARSGDSYCGQSGAGYTGVVAALGRGCFVLALCCVARLVLWPVRRQTLGRAPAADPVS